jgi:Lysyl oxidase/S-layer homology domain
MTTARRGVALAAVLVLGMLVGAPRQESLRAGSEVLPDLAMAPLGRSHGNDWRIQWVNGRRLLRFTGMFVNVGSGHFEVCGSRPNTSTPMTVHQIVYQSSARAPQNGSCAPEAMRSRTIRTNAQARYAGDGHDHWHVQEIVRYDLWGGEGTFRGAKVGFCFLDSDAYNGSLPGYSGGYYRYSWCRTDPDALNNRMGLSIGMGDEYEWFLAWQWIDITGLSSGTYTVRAKVDPYGHFVEEDETNQCAYAVVSFTTASNAVNVEERAHDCVNDWAGSSFGEHIAWMLEEGISTGCAPDLFCTYNSVTRGEMAAFLDRALDLPATSEDRFDDDETSTFELSINRLAAAGVTSGCGDRRYCPNRTITRGEMAAFLERALSLPAATADYYSDDDGTTFEDSINAVTEAGIATGCTSTRYCPDRPVRRGEMAAFLHRALT